MYLNKDNNNPKLEHTPEVLQDTYLNMELALPWDDEGPQFARVTKSLRNNEEISIGTAYDNPLLDSRICEVEYNDGHKASLSANSIAQHIFAQVDDEDNRFVLLDSIADYRTNSTELKQQESIIISKNGGRRRKETTKGWEILLQWKDGRSVWEGIKDIKQSYPVDLVDFAIQKGIAEEPAFA